MEMPSRRTNNFHEITQNFEKIRIKMGNNHVGKTTNTPKVNTWVNIFYVHTYRVGQIK